MKKSNLKTTMRLELNNGRLGIVLADIQKIALENGGYTTFSTFSDDLICISNPAYSVKKVYEGDTHSGMLDFQKLGPCIWERKEKSKQQLKIEELEKTIQEASQQIAELKASV